MNVKIKTTYAYSPNDSLSIGIKKRSKSAYLSQKGYKYWFRAGIDRPGVVVCTCNSTALGARPSGWFACGSTVRVLAHVDRASTASVASICVCGRKSRTCRLSKEGRTGSGPKGSRQKHPASRQCWDSARECAATYSPRYTIGPRSFCSFCFYSFCPNKILGLGGQMQWS